MNNRYTRQENKIIVNENKDEEDDKSNYDPDAKILSKFMKEQNKEKENFIYGKIKIPEEKNNYLNIIIYFMTNYFYLIKYLILDYIK